MPCFIKIILIIIVRRSKPSKYPPLFGETLVSPSDSLVYLGEIIVYLGDSLVYFGDSLVYFGKKNETFTDFIVYPARFWFISPRFSFISAI
jgi:hypothetical protein